MASVDINVLKELRAITHAPLKDCKEALEEAGGDLERAHEVLKEKGALKAAKKADRQTNEGVVMVKDFPGKVVAVALACETDFVAKNDAFRSLTEELVDLVAKHVNTCASYDELSQDVKDAMQKLLDDNQLKIGENMQVQEVEVLPVDKSVYVYRHPGDRIVAVIHYDGDEELAKGVALQVAAMNPSYLSVSDVDTEEVEAMKAKYTEELADSNKPADIQEKIIEGKLAKDLAEVVLMEQQSIVDDTKKVKDTLGSTTVTMYSRYSI